MRLPRIALVLGVIAIACAVTATVKARETTMTSERKTGVNNEQPPERQTRAATVPDSASPMTSLPASLAGTDRDGDLAVTVSRGTIRLFDYYLTTLGETDLAGVRALVAAEVARQSPSTAAEVLALFDRYIIYLGDVQGVHASTLDNYFAQTLALQRHHFGSDADTLFGEENALAAQLLAIRM